MAINYNEEEFGLQVPNNNQGIMEVADAYTTPTAGDYGFSLIELDRLKRGGYNPGEVSNWENKEDVQSLIRSLEPTAMAISNYDDLFGPKTMTDAFGTTHTLAAANKPDLYTGDISAKTGQRLRDPFAPFQNEMVGPNPHDPSVYDRYGNIQMALEDQDFYEDPKGLAQLFQNLDPSAWGTALKNKAGQGWDFAKQIPGMAMGALSGIPGIGMAMGLLSKLGKPDTPYQKFQKQMFEDMGWQGESNKDPWGKNINSAFGDYDVTEQWGDLMGSKLGDNYGYKDAFADGVLDQNELDKMKAAGLKGWQLNRAIGLSTAAKKAQAWKDKKAQEKIITNQMKNIDTGGGKTTTYTPTGNYGKKQGTTGSWTPGGSYQGAKSSPKGYSSRSHSGGNYGGQHHWARGGRVGYANGGLASLFTRRG